MAAKQGRTGMRVTIGELLGRVSATEGQAMERDLDMKVWEAEHAEEIKASRVRYGEALARIRREGR